MQLCYLYRKRAGNFHHGDVRHALNLIICTKDGIPSFSKTINDKGIANILRSKEKYKPWFRKISERRFVMAATVNKDAKTGRFVSNADVKRRPATTYKQTVKKGK